MKSYLDYDGSKLEVYLSHAYNGSIDIEIYEHDDVFGEHNIMNLEFGSLLNSILNTVVIEMDKQ